MGCCSGRCLLITLCILQLAATIERQVFDFLGYMWAPIIGNFLQIIFIILALFGAVQYRPKVVIIYAVWCLIWLGWNIFVICFYLEVGILRRDSPILNLGTGNRSWWVNNGIGCQGDASTVDGGATNQVDGAGCLLQYYYVEIIHAGVQCILSLFGFCVACYVIYVFTEEDDSSQPVHDELEYIKMRYKSPARCSFRDNKTYETLTTTLTRSTLSDRGLDGPDSGDSMDRTMPRNKHSPNKGSLRKKSHNTNSPVGQTILENDQPFAEINSMHQQPLRAQNPKPHQKSNTQIPEYNGPRSVDFGSPNPSSNHDINNEYNHSQSRNYIEHGSRPSVHQDYTTGHPSAYSGQPLEGSGDYGHHQPSDFGREGPPGYHRNDPVSNRVRNQSPHDFSRQSPVDNMPYYPPPQGGVRSQDISSRSESQSYQPSGYGPRQQNTQHQPQGQFRYDLGGQTSGSTVI